MVLLIFGLCGILVALWLVTGEIWHERAFPKATLWKSLCLIALSLLCLSFAPY